MSWGHGTPSKGSTFGGNASSHDASRKTWAGAGRSTSITVAAVSPTSPPTVISLNIATGPTAGGTAIVITGTNFFNVSSVTIGGNPATSIVTVNSTTINCTTPAGSGTVDVAVTTPAGTGIGHNLFTYLGFPAVYQGSPSITVTAIDVTGGIVMSRSSGQVPAFVHLSASAITCTGTAVAGSVVPYRDLEFTWIGDATLTTETMTDYGASSPNGVSINANGTVSGPEAVFVCRSVGTYTFQLLVRGKNGAGFTTATVTGNFTANPFTASGGEWYFDSAAAGGGNGTIGLPFNDIATMNTKLHTASTLVHVKKGSSWSTTVGIGTLGVANSTITGPTRIDAYGSGANPLITIPSGVDNALVFQQSNSDIVISNIDFHCDNNPTGAGGNTGPEVVFMQCNNSGSTAVDRYLDNCNISSSQNGVPPLNLGDYGAGIGGQTGTARMGCWNCTLTNTGTANYGLYSLPYQWGFFVGGSVIGPGSDNVRHQHIYPQVRNHGCYRYINFGSGTNRNFCININYDPVNAGDQPEYAQYHCVDGCNLTGPVRGVDGSNGDEQPSESRFKNFVVQRCLFNNLSEGCTSMTCTESVAIRDCFVWNIDTAVDATVAFVIPPCAGAGELRFYRNKIWRQSTGGGSPTDEGILSATGTFNNPQIITNNIIQDQRSNADINELWGGTNPLASLQSAGTVWDNNQYWAPNDATPFWVSDVSNVSFAGWKSGTGFDANATNANPNWPDPANGVFS